MFIVLTVYVVCMLRCFLRNSFLNLRGCIQYGDVICKTHNFLWSLCRVISVFLQNLINDSNLYDH